MGDLAYEKLCYLEVPLLCRQEEGGVPVGVRPTHVLSGCSAFSTGRQRDFHFAKSWAF